MAEVRGINIYAVQRVDGRDRKQLERLCRYIIRPPVANERLRGLSDGRYELTLKSPWRDGTAAVRLEPFNLLARLVAAIPPPKFHMVRYFGVFSSHAKARREIVPHNPRDSERDKPAPTRGDQAELSLLLNGKSELDKLPVRNRWAWLLRRVFQAEVETCPKCGGAMRWLKVATTSRDIQDLLREHELPFREQPPPFRSAIKRGQLPLPFG